MIGNRLLDGLPPHELDRIRPDLDVVRLAPRQFFLAAREPLAYVYFPQGGLVSLMTSVITGTTVQAAAAGRDGMLGVSLILDANDPPFEMTCLVAGDALRMSASRLTAHARVLAGFQQRLLRYAHGVFNEAVRTAACNGLHGVEQRLARCLLLSRDRLDTDQLPITHEVLGHMLGTTRALVTQTLNRLQSADLMQHSRGIIRIIDPAGLQALACEDYSAIQAEYSRLMC
jgi:CRP-like cAMP-binding protein